MTTTGVRKDVCRVALSLSRHLRTSNVCVLLENCLEPYLGQFRKKVRLAERDGCFRESRLRWLLIGRGPISSVTEVLLDMENPVHTGPEG